jgi:hypothetical protein
VAVGGGGPPLRGPGRDGAALRLMRGDPPQWSERPCLPRRPVDRGRAARPAQLSAPLELLYRRALFSPKIARDSG